ncbi:tetratricopeptide repeat protein [Rhodoflexus sp.]
MRSIQVVLLFFCLSASLSAISCPPLQPYFSFEENERQAYLHLLDLHFAPARAAIERIPTNNLVRIYLENWADVLQMLSNQDQILYSERLHLREQRLQSIMRSNRKSPYFLFLQAEIRLQWALAQVVFEEPLAAAWNIRKAFHLLEENSRYYPDFEGNRKSLGVLQVLFGAVPSQYEWMLSLWGLSGSIERGLTILQEVASGASVYAPEAALWLTLLSSQLDNQFAGICCLNSLSHGKWLAAAAFRRSGNSAKALQLLADLPAHAPSLICWEKATALLNSGNYEAALHWLDLFDKQHRGADLRKDAQLKRFWCLWLLNRQEQARAAYRKIATTGRTQTEADRNAAYFAAQQPLPDKRLVQARLLADGGYVEDSEKVLQNIDFQILDSNDRSEFYYRKARNAQQLGQYRQALVYYEACMQLAGGAVWYFLPKAALQAGLLCRDYTKDNKKARYYLTRAIEYRQHPYKKSIDRKAKAALKMLAD